MRVNKKDSLFIAINHSFQYKFLVGMLFLILGGTDVVEAVTPRIWKENSQIAFEKGEVDGLSLTKEGTVTLAPKWDLMADTGAHFVWSLASDSKGNIYLGTGVEGRVYALKEGSKTPSLIFDAEEETKIFALTVGPDGALYAGTSPHGLIYRIVPNKPAEVYCQTGDLHVWSLLWVQDKLYATTGGEVGRIVKVVKNNAEVIYQSNDPNVISLTLGQDGSLYAGTDQNGLIYKVMPNGTVSVFYDAGEKEVHAIAVGQDGMVYAAAMAGHSDEKKNGNGDGKGSVLYAIRPSGSALRLWEIDDPLLLSVTVDADGSLRVVTGKKGRVYRIWPDGTYTLLAQLKDVHPWAVLPTSDGALWMGSSGDGQLYKLGTHYVSEGSLTSEVKDFTLTSYWGQAHWQAQLQSGTSVVLQTRSGNSDTPDDTWSVWSESLKASGGQIMSKPARFLQYRLHLKSSSDQITPAVREVRLAGLQENVAPMVLSVKVVQDEDGDPKRDRRSLQKIVWEAGDVNDDELLYTVSFREVGGAKWFVLKEDVTGSQFLWDTETVPDGEVMVRVVASDRGSNPLTKALVGEAVGLPMVIDNTPPTIKIASVNQLGVGRVGVVGVIEDLQSALVSAKYAINSGAWEIVFSDDSIFDSQKEKLNFQIANLKVGAYTLVIRSEDVMGNVGVGKTTFDVK